jgi:hypothetical protein
VELAGQIRELATRTLHAEFRHLRRRTPASSSSTTAAGPSRRSGRDSRGRLRSRCRHWESRPIRARSS